MARKNEYNYFDAFISLAEHSCKAALIAKETIDNFKQSEMPERLKYIHSVEHSADDKKHELIKALSREFLPPIEIEDIAILAQLLDSVTDSIEDVIIKTYAYNITKIRPEAIAFLEIITKCSEKMKNLMEQFKNFKKNTAIGPLVIEINRLENDGDDLYTKAMHELHSTSKDPIEILAWTNMLDCLEICCDNMEHVADAVENIVMKNT